MLRWGEYLLLTVGFICLGWVGYSYAATYLFQSYETYLSGEMLRGRQATMSGILGGGHFRPGRLRGHAHGGTEA